MPEISSEREAEIEEVFSDTLPVIQMALVHYRLKNGDRLALERDLRLWFRRLVVRAGNDRTPVSAFRNYLLVATCQFAYAYQSRRPEALAGDPRLVEVLALNPRTVARELQKMLEPEGSRWRDSGQAVG